MDLGANVINAVSTLRLVSTEVGAMLAEVERLLLDPATSRVVTAMGENRIPSADKVVSDGWLRTYEVRERREGRGQRRRLGQLSLMVDIGRSGGPAIAMGHPCVVVAWTIPAPGDSWTEVLLSGEFWPVSSDYYDVIAERLLVWHGRGDGGVAVVTTDLAREAWFYMVPLFALEGSSDLQDLLLRPVSRMLDGLSPEQAFGDESRVVRLTWQDDGAPRFVEVT